MYVAEYFKVGSGLPVDCTVGLQNKDEAIQHARRVAVDKKYCGFWIGHKPNKAGVDPVRLEYHPVWWSPVCKPTFGTVLYRQRG